MTESQEAAYITAQAAVLIARVAGMVAENAHRASKSEAPMYREKDFDAAINESGCHHNAVLETFRR